MNIPGVVDIYNTVAGGVGPASGTVPIGGTGGDEFYILAPGVNAPPGGGNYTMAQLVAMGVYVDLGNAEDPVTGPATLQKVYANLNLAAHQTLAESLKRESGSANFEHKFNDTLTASATILYAQTITESTLNAQPLGPRSTIRRIPGWTRIWTSGPHADSGGGRPVLLLHGPDQSVHAQFPPGG